MGLSAKEWRKIVRKAFFKIETEVENSDIAFQDFLVHFYVEEKQRLFQISFEGLTKAQVKTEYNGLYVPAVGLFTFGRLDVVDEILTSNPYGTGLVKEFVFVLNHLSPMPQDINPLRSPNVAQEWFRANADKLVWSQQEEKFVWKDQVQVE